jgi:hypothetical protein
MFRKINDHGFFFSRSFSRSPSLRVIHLDFDMSLDSLCESFLLSSDAIVAWEIEDLIDEVIDDDDDDVDDDVDDVGAVDMTDEADEDEETETAKGVVDAKFFGPVTVVAEVAAGAIAIGAEVEA